MNSLLKLILLVILAVVLLLVVVLNSKPLNSCLGDGEVSDEYINFCLRKNGGNNR